MSTREEFEKWADGRGFDLTLFSDSDWYRNDYTHIAWGAWQAATLRAVRICEHQAEQAITSTGSARATFCADRIAGDQS